jgi:hypothetical protein
VIETYVYLYTARKEQDEVLIYYYDLFLMHAQLACEVENDVQGFESLWSIEKIIPG